VAAMAEASPAGERVSRVGPVRRRGPRLWLVLVLTWVTLIPLFLLALFTDLPRIFVSAETHQRLRSAFGLGGGGTTAPVEPSKVSDEWLTQQLTAASAAAQAKNYTRAVEIYDAIIAKTGDAATWQPRKQALLQQKAAEDRKERLTKLKERLEMAEGLASDQKFDDALAVLRNVGKDDRTWLASLGVSVEKMETTIREDQAKAVRMKQLDDKLVADLAQANTLRTGGKPADALKAYKQIASAYPADLVRKRIDLDQTIADIQTQMTAAATPPATPGGPATPGSPAAPPEQIKTARDEMMNQAAALEKSEKFAEALAKLEEVKQKIEQQYWPENLEKRIRDVKAKKEALEFFGVEGPKKPAKTP